MPNVNSEGMILKPSERDGIVINDAHAHGMNRPNMTGGEVLTAQHPPWRKDNKANRI